MVRVVSDGVLAFFGDGPSKADDRVDECVANEVMSGTACCGELLAIHEMGETSFSADVPKIKGARINTFVSTWGNTKAEAKGAGVLGAGHGSLDREGIGSHPEAEVGATQRFDALDSEGSLSFTERLLFCVVDGALHVHAGGPLLGRNKGPQDLVRGSSASVPVRSAGIHSLERIGYVGPMSDRARTSCALFQTGGLGDLRLTKMS